MNCMRRLGVSFLIAGGCTVAGIALGTPVIGVPTTSIPSPQPLGTVVTITASATDADPGTISYRYQIGGAGSTSLAMARDFSVDNTFVFTPTRQEGSYRIVVTARNNATGHMAANQIGSYRFTSLVKGPAPVVTPTANPLVALFSTPPCAAGATYMRAAVLKSASTVPFYTSWLPCSSGKNMNFVIAGMRASTAYTINSQTTDGTTIVAGAKVPFTTGTPSVTFPAVAIQTALMPQDDQTERFMLMSTTQPFPLAIDLSGSPVWYYLDPTGAPPLLTRPMAGGEILMIASGKNSAGTSVSAGQILREIDLAGNIIRETNATRLSEQVAALSGIASSCQVGGNDCLVGAIHHEAFPLPNGHTLVMTDEEKIFTDGTQGSSPANPVDIVGDVIVDLDTNWQVTWYWRAFDHLNANRAAILGETCVNGAAGCPPILLTTGTAQDWLHGNALFYNPNDGSILMSMRHQDWIIKIDYGNGTGSKNILWTLGKGGDFQIDSGDSYPWFSHQHDPGFLQGGSTQLALFDNGNTRISPPPTGLGFGNSRGYVLNVDEAHRTVTPVLLADLGFYSVALGTAELLLNGDYHFEAGFSNSLPPYSESIEAFPDGTLGYTTKIPGTLVYRNFRMLNLYTPPVKD